MLNEVAYEEAEVQPRVQARGGQAGTGAGCFQRPGARDLGISPNVVSRWVREAGGDVRKAFPGHGQRHSDASEIE